MSQPIQPSAGERLGRLLKYLKADPANSSLLADALVLAADAQDPAAAGSLLAHLDKHGIQDPLLSAHACLLALKLQDFRSAATHGEAALAGGLDAPALRFNTAYAQYYLGDHERANTLLTAAEANYADYATESLILKARLLHHLERPEEAIGFLQQAIARQPEQAEALGVMALLQAEEGDYAQATAYADRALALAPQQPEALLARADSYFDQHNMPAARLAYEATIAAHPANGRAWSGLGQIAFDQFEFVEAEKFLQQAVVHMPNHIGTWHVLAWIYILQGQLEKAREVLLKSYALDRSFGDTHGGLAVVDALEGKEAEARTGIRKALKLAPEGMAARYAELVLLEKSGDLEAAREMVERVLSQPVDDSGTLRRSLVEKKLRELQQTKPKNTH